MTATLPSPLAAAFSTAEKARITAASIAIESLEARLAEVEDLRAAITAAEADFVSGKLDIVAAAGILSVTNDVNARAALQMRLRGPVKAAIKSAVQSVADLLTKADQHRIDVIAAQARELEKAERDSFKAYGLPDDFKPSELLRVIRTKHSRALENSKVVTYTKSSLTSLLATI